MFLNDLPALDTSHIDFTPIDTSSLISNLPAINLPSAPADIPTLPVTTVSYTPPQIPVMSPITVNFTPTQQTIPTLPLTTVTMPPAPSTNVAPAAPTSQSTGDWFSRNIAPLLSTGIQAYAAVKQYDTAANIAQANLQAQTAALTKGLPVGVSPNALLTRPTLTASQLSTMTPAQLQAYYAGLPGSTGVSTGGILSSLGMGGMSTTELMLLAGGGLLLMMMLMNNKK